MKIPETPFALCIGCHDVFPETDDTLQTLRRLLAEMDRAQVLLWCGRINLALYLQLPATGAADENAFERDRRKQGLLARHLFTRDQVERVCRIFRDEIAKHSDPMLPTVFFRAQVLELIRWASVYCREVPNSFFDAPGAREPVVKALLIAGALWNRRTYHRASSNASLPALETNRHLVTFRNALEQETAVLDLLRALARAGEFFRQHFPTNYARATKRNFEADFSAATGLSLQEYYDCCSAMTASVVRRAGAGFDLSAGPQFNPGTFCRAAKQELQATFCRFIRLKSQTVDEFGAECFGANGPDRADELRPFSVVPLARRPILRLTESLAIVPDLDSFAQATLLGPLFHVLEHVDPRDVSANAVFGAFGQAFEDYCRSVLQRMFPGRPRLAQRLHAPLADSCGREIADACVDYGNAMVLFEAKAVFVDRSAQAGDPEEYMGALAEKYVVGEDRRQAITQLANAIVGLASGSRLPVGMSVAGVSVLIPVLLVRDPLMDAPLHCRYLAGEFKTALGPDSTVEAGNMKKGRLFVTPLIVMTVETLEDLESSRIDLQKFLTDYSSEFPDRLQTLRYYLGISEYGRRVTYNDRLREAASRQFERLSSFFSTPPWEESVEPSAGANSQRSADAR